MNQPVQVLLPLNVLASILNMLVAKKEKTNEDVNTIDILYAALKTGGK